MNLLIEWNANVIHDTGDHLKYQSGNTMYDAYSFL